MSDRVAIIGGSKVGRDHFPFAISNPGSALPIATFPHGFTLSEFTQIFYLVRQWRTEISLTWTTVGPVSHSGTASVVWEPIVFPQEPSVLDPYPPTRESDLVLPRSLDWGWDADDGYGANGPTIISESFTGDAFQGYAIEISYDVNVHFYDNKFWPELVISLFDTAGNRANTWEVALTRHVGDVTFRGATIPLNAAAVSGGIGVTSCSVAITPEQYWAYATKAGLPVYDTATGTQLNDPLS